jgi:predicted phosphodiesterase
MKKCPIISVLILLCVFFDMDSVQGGRPDPGLLGHWKFMPSNLTGREIRDQGRTAPVIIEGPMKWSGDQTMEALVLESQTRAMISTDLKNVPLPVRRMTVEAWVSITKPGDVGCIIGAFPEDGKFKQGWFLGYHGNRFCLGVADSLVGRIFEVSTENPFEPNRWYHVAGTFDGEQKKIYVNGQLENMSKSGRYDIGYPDKGGYAIGVYREDGKDIPMNGMIREVRVYDRVLTQGEIRRQIFEQNLPVPMIVTGPYLQQGTQTTQTIMWETNEPGTSVVEYGEKVPLTLHVKSKGSKAIHEVKLSNLKPQTQYFYRVHSQTAKGTLVSPTYTFQTSVSVKEDAAFAFVVMGDTFTWVPDYERPRIFDLAWKERPNFVLHVGDAIPDGRDKQYLWPREWLLPAGELMSRVPLYVAIGNHDQNADWFYKYVSYPQPENFYSFDYGNAHFAIIDSNQSSEIIPGGKQYQWLDKDLGESKAKWKFVAFHHPPYVSDDDDYGDTWKERPSACGDGTRLLVPLLEKHDVDIVWSGHIHLYERTWPIRAGKVDQKNGVIYITTGGGGSDLEEFSPVRSWFTAKVLRNWEYCLINIHGDTLSLMAYDIDGRLFDLMNLCKDN